jgi:hypothetical protein
VEAEADALRWRLDRLAEILARLREEDESRHVDLIRDIYQSRLRDLEDAAA